VRLKAHTAHGPYQAERVIYPLSCDGTQHEVSGKAYILVPDLTLTVGLFPDPSPSGPIGTVTGSQWQGMRHHDIANVRGLFYEQDRTIGIWEVDAWGQLDEFSHGRLWLAETGAAVMATRAIHRGGRSALRRRRTNLVVFPGSALAYKDGWQAIADRLPANAVLIVLPSYSRTQKESLLVLAKLLATAGRQVRVVPESEAIRARQLKRASRSRGKTYG
jgi:hypothetical protein